MKLEPCDFCGVGELKFVPKEEPFTEHFKCTVCDAIYEVEWEVNFELDEAPVAQSESEQ